MFSFWGRHQQIRYVRHDDYMKLYELVIKQSERIAILRHRLDKLESTIYIPNQPVSPPEPSLLTEEEQTFLEMITTGGINRLEDGIPQSMDDD